MVYVLVSPNFSPAFQRNFSPSFRTEHNGGYSVWSRFVSIDILLVSQFTFYGNAGKGHRPSFIEAARPEVAESLYEEYVKHRLSKELGHPVYGGSFSASMQVSRVNDQPVTIWMERNLEKTQNYRVSRTEIRQGDRPSSSLSASPCSSE